MESTVQITGLAHGGAGVGRIDGKVVFVPLTAPGDEVSVEVTADKKSFYEGVLKKVVKPSPSRVEPRCPLFGLCGGCGLQHIDYPVQVEWKKNIFEETLKRIGGVEGVIFDPPAPSPQAFNYRSRARFHVSGDYWGFFESKSHRVVEMDDCPILDPKVNSAYKGIKDALKGKIKHLFAVDIGVGETDGKAVAAFHLTAQESFRWEGLLKETGLLKGLEVWLYPQRNDRNRGALKLSLGESDLAYDIAGLRLKAGISSFSQVNRLQNRNLVDRAVEYAGLKGAEAVLDLFCGAGNLTFPIAKRAASVTGVESVPGAVSSARKNAIENSIKNADFIESEALTWLKQDIKGLEKQRYSVVVLDPPRGGDPGVAGKLARLRPKEIVYVSCSPPTLARDISILASAGYRAVSSGLFDMFPQTFHIESVARLRLE